VDQLCSLIHSNIGGGYPSAGSLQTTFHVIRLWNISRTMVISDYTPLISHSRFLKSLWHVQMYMSYLLLNSTKQHWTNMYLNYKHSILTS
jgi:hypothetical protein